MQKHFPAVGQTVRAREIDAPLGRERHLPIKGSDLAGVVGREFAGVPDVRAFQDRNPDLLTFKADLRTGYGARVGLASERQFHVLLPVLEHVHGYRFARPSQV